MPYAIQEAEIRARIAERVATTPETGIVRHRGVYARSDADYLQLLTIAPTVSSFDPSDYPSGFDPAEYLNGYTRGWIVEYRGALETETGSDRSVKRLMRYRLIATLQFEDKIRSDGTSSFDVFVEMVEAVQNRFANWRRLGYAATDPFVYHKYLQFDTDFELGRWGDKYVHLGIGSLLVEVETCV